MEPVILNYTNDITRLFLIVNWNVLKDTKCSDVLRRIYNEENRNIENKIKPASIVLYNCGRLANRRMMGENQIKGLDPRDAGNIYVFNNNTDNTLMF